MQIIPYFYSIVLAVYATGKLKIYYLQYKSDVHKN